MQKIPNEALGRLDVETFKQAPKIPLTIVLDSVRSMHNVGSIFRTADAYRIEKILLCGTTPTPPHREIHKTALGATESVEWAYYPDILQTLGNLKKAGYTLIAIEQATDAITPADVPHICLQHQKFALIFGHEVLGVSQEAIDQCDYCLELPQYGTKHSLNISVCAGIVLYEFFNNLRARISL
ncbi:RNA methyltransferase [Thermaurantimonas aggregans]|uniref:RNA methyltransferase n=1 Tax=Thermaurantimonas aggregans TaxID=2173829 RepID=A0A401XJJ3_9FLAO|nr:RNA methyltransferase [Thermaurantimonas aggregans]MCX8148716.1 RNA methyltransferase [Thermaurantimonas aggregans]GCD77182.1 RNA methyltransferase [Thermaurantimonas aggregans]